MASYIVIEGTDGAGKSTVAKRLVDERNRRGQKTILVNKLYQKKPMPGPATLSPGLAEHLHSLQSVVYGPFPEGREIWGDHHFLFMLGSWYSILDKMIIRPALEEGVSVVMDNAHYKTMARYELKSDFPQDLAPRVFQNLLKPDCTIFLKVQPEVSLSRKNKIDSIETGFRGISSNSFVDHQRQVLSILEKYALRERWNTIVADTLSENDVYGACMHLLGESNL